MTEESPFNFSKILSDLQTRREFLKRFSKGLGYTAVTATLPACGGGGGGDDDDEQQPPPPSADIPAASVEYTVLKRTSFGPHRDALAEINALGIDAYLEQQLNYSQINDGSLESDIATLFPLTQQTAKQLYSGFPANIGSVAVQMISAAQYRQIFSKRQLYEVMVEFWTNHFNIHLLNGLGPTLKPEDDLQVIRQHALGNFRDLLRASAKSPAMLFYLDNFFNIASAPNENYARELMELHTLGVDGGYSEDDVKEVARCFTGWSIRFFDDAQGDMGTYTYEPLLHDNEAKTVLGNNIPAGGGQNDGEQVLDILASHPSTANYLATKLCQRFISDTPDSQSINAVANAFLTSDGDIGETLRALFTTDAFRTTADQKFTRPTEFLAGTIRALAPDTAYPSDNGILFFFAQSILGQLPYYWPTPDGYPDKEDYWLNTGGILNRWRLAFLSFASVLPVINTFDLDYAPLLNGANTLASMVDALTDSILMRSLSELDRVQILDWLTLEYNLSEDAELAPALIEQVAPLIATVLISSAYFQLR